MGEVIEKRYHLEAKFAPGEAVWVVQDTVKPPGASLSRGHIERVSVTHEAVASGVESVEEYGVCVPALGLSRRDLELELESFGLNLFRISDKDRAEQEWHARMGLWADKNKGED